MKVLDNLETSRLQWCGQGDKCYLAAESYPNGRLGLQIIGYIPLEEQDEAGCVEEPIATCTVNLPEEKCPPGEVFVKDYSENEGMVRQLQAWQVIEAKATAVAHSGFVLIERFQLTPKFLEALAKAGFSHLE